MIKVICLLYSVQLKYAYLFLGFQLFAGASAAASTGATMSDDDDDDGYDSDYGPYDPNMDPHDVVGNYGPLVPTESERTLMERVRQELKYELKQVHHIHLVGNFTFLIVFFACVLVLTSFHCCFVECFRDTGIKSLMCERRYSASVELGNCLRALQRF